MFKLRSSRFALPFFINHFTSEEIKKWIEEGEVGEVVTKVREVNNEDVAEFRDKGEKAKCEASLGGSTCGKQWG